MKHRRLDLVVLVVCLVWAAIILPRMVTGRWSPGAEAAIIWAGGLLRMALLAVTAVASARAAGAISVDNPARLAQSLMAGGFVTYLLAQVTLFVLQVRHGGVAPYPSVADLGFLVAMVLLIAGVGAAIRGWLSLGLFPDGGRRAATAAAAAAIPLAIGVVITVRALMGAGSPPLQMMADVGYPVLDSVLLILTAAMLRLALLLGGGAVGIVWRSLLLGFLAMALGDIVYSFFAGFDLDVLDPVLDLLYTVSYALLARGAVLQLRLLRE